MAGEAADADEAQSKELQKRKVVNLLKLSSFLSVCQHTVMIQSEPMLLKELCGGDVGASTKLLANTQGIVGLLGLFLNQAGGKMSDAIGRKPFLLLGPLGNIILGAVVFKNAKNRLLVTLCRVIRLMITTFSSTVMVQASLADTITGKELAIASSQIGAIVGLAMVVSPVIESTLLRVTKNSLRSVYAALSVIGLLQAITNASLMPETLPAAKTRLSDAIRLQTFNPFGFLKIYTKGSMALKKLVSTSTTQMFLEGKNISDVGMAYMREDLGWNVDHIRNYVVSYGILCILTGTYVTPAILRNTTARMFTTALDLGQTIAYTLRASMQTGVVWLATLPLILPGVNGNTAQALKALSMDRARAEGFQNGEFSAYTNNLRGLAGSLAPVMWGNTYSWFKSQGKGGGNVYWAFALVGGLLPEAMLAMTSNEELEQVKSAKAS